MLSLAHTAAVHFGDVAGSGHRQSGEPNLAAAQQMIDILALLEEKTRGNLTAEERQLLEQLLYELRLRYVEASKARRRPSPRASSSLDVDGLTITRALEGDLAARSRSSAPARLTACR